MHFKRKFARSARVALVGILILGGSMQSAFAHDVPRERHVKEKVYVALEGEGSIKVVDGNRGSVTRIIRLSRWHKGGWLMYMPHNVQVAPDGSAVWVTANVGEHMRRRDMPANAMQNVHDDNDEMKPKEMDEIIVINPWTDRIVKRIPLAMDAHLSHVVLTPDGAYALAAAQKEGAIYRINTRTFAVEKKIAVDAGSEPHGLRVAPDGSVAYVALLKGKALGVMDLKTDAVTSVPLDGAAVQAGVTADGKYAFASLYDTKKLAMYDVASKEVSYVSLPSSAKGPVQIYSTPDSRFVYVADQGYYFGQPVSDRVYKIAIKEAAIVKEIKAGDAPHGIVISPDARRAYVTNLMGKDISVIDTATDREIKRIRVGSMPNGISVWTLKTAGTP